ncbi:MAG: hypothetical protein AAF288_08705 [Planctomycetota bacterium]
MPTVEEALSSTPTTDIDAPREVRYLEIERVLGFAKTHRGVYPRGRFEHGMSVYFRGPEPESVRAAVLCFAQPDRSRVLVVCAPGIDDESGSADVPRLRSAVDHLMLKLAARRIARVRVVAAGGATMPGWLASAAVWRDEANAAQRDPKPRAAPASPESKADDAPPQAA